MLSTYSFTCMMIAVNNSWFVVSVTEGEVSFKLKVSAEIAPDVQIVAYAILPSETVIAHSADFSTEKCFSNKVSIRRRLVVLTVLVRSRCRIKVCYLYYKRSICGPPRQPPRPTEVSLTSGHIVQM